VKTIKTSVLSVLALSFLSTACMEIGAIPLLTKKESSSPKKNKSKSNLVTNKSASVNQEIGDEAVTMHVISQKELRMQELAGKVLGMNSQAARELLKNLPQSSASADKSAKKQVKMMDTKAESLLIGMPVGLIGEQSIFGGVITKVTDKTNETLGSLKLTDLTPIHVRPLIVADGEDFYVALIGCTSACNEESEQKPLIYIPVSSISDDGKLIYLDLSAIGKGLDLIKMLDEDGEYTKLISIASTTTAFDYSVSTLVFDIVSNMVAVGTKPEDYATAPKTDFTVRWYLKLNSGSNPAFTARPATAGVGFFKTERSENSKITRFSTTDFGKTVKYYIKNVPEKFKPVFAGAFDNWNTEFTKIIGRDLLSYEFIDATDPRSSAIVAGDIRFNVLEWDLNNIASYGGLGPSIANQFTGETLSANVLIQGPTIIDLYTKWFALSQTARGLIAEGRSNEADVIVAKFHKEASAEMASRSNVKFAMSLNKLDMNIHAQRAELEDPMIKNHFEIVPAGITFDKYMTGYFTEMLEHELGHNLGLRHNFKGNLGAYETGEKGSVSRSIMEYLGRPYRHLSAIGLYDKMAISYGYRGVAPKNLNWFCTDEDQGSDKATLAAKSPECTKADATSDPFSFWEARLARVIDLIIDVNSASAPVWKASEVSTQIDEAVTGLTAYAASAERTADTWTNFFGKGERPDKSDAAGIKAFVLGAIKKKICNPELASIIAAKESAESIKLAQDNLDALKKAVEKKTLEVAVYSAEQIKCD
jgi:hypothetical protein